MMKIKIPDEVRHAIKDADMAAFARLSAKIRTEKAGKEREETRLRKLDDLRTVHRDELRKCAEYVFEWRAAFAKTEEAKRIRELIGGTCITVFCAKYWLGERLPANDQQAWALLIIDGWDPGSVGLPPFRYEEVFKGHVSYEKSIAGSQALINTVHPDFLKELHDHLNGLDAWRFILQDLRRFTGR